MARTGDVFTLHDGERVTVRTPAAETNGELLEVEAEWAPLEHRPPVHFHPAQTERFEVREGELSVEVEGATHVLRTGDSFDIPRGAVHKMWNSGETTTRASWQVRPALRTEEFFATVHGLRASGHRNRAGMLTPLAAGAVLAEYRDEFRVPIPGPLQRPVLAVLGALARVRGYRAVTEAAGAGG